MVTKRQALEELAKRKARKDFWSFCLYMDYAFFTERDVLKRVGIALNNAYYSDKKRYKINLATPRRLGKSYTIRLFIAWVLGKDNKDEVITASYSIDKARELNGGVFNYIIQSDRYKSLFSLPELIEDTKDKKVFKNHHRASLIATSSKAGATGIGARILIGDDLYRNVDEALSPTINSKVINNYNNTLANSLDHDNQIEIIIGTRWAYGELADTLETQDYFDEVIKIKAIQDDGTSFCEAVKTVEELEEERKKIGDDLFQALWQQEPMLSKDGLFKMADFNYINDIDLENMFKYSRFALIDPKAKGKDKYAVGIFCITDLGLVLEDCIYTAEPLNKPLIKRTADLVNYYRCDYVFIETNKEYTLATYMKDLVNANIRDFVTTQNKEMKILVNSMFVKQVIIRQTNDEEYLQFMNELYKYSHTKSEFDDATDVMTMAVIKARENARLLGLRSM